MKKQTYFLLVLLAFTLFSNGQTKQEKAVDQAVEVFKKAMVNADKNLLESICADQLVYGHSSGKVQNKAEFVAEVLSGQPIDYVSIDTADQTIKMSGKVAVVRHIFSAETSANGTPGKLRIGNTLIFQKQHGKWKLLARQAYKLP